MADVSGPVPVGAGLTDNISISAIQQISCSAILELFIQLEILGYKVGS
jgi:hypothetical protein